MFKYFLDLIIKYFSFIQCLKFIFYKFYKFDYNRDFKQYIAIVKNETCEKQTYNYKFVTIPCKAVYIYKINKIRGWPFSVITYVDDCFYTENLDITTDKAFAHRAIARKWRD